MIHALLNLGRVLYCGSPRVSCDTQPSSLAYPDEKARLCGTVTVLNWHGYQAQFLPAALHPNPAEFTTDARSFQRWSPPKALRHSLSAHSAY